MRRRVVRAVVAVGLSAGSVVATAGPAWAPRVHTRPADECKDGQWQGQYRNQGQCVSAQRRR